MADANKTLITRADVTSILTPATGRRALVIDGATIELGDTGMRDLSGLFIADTVAAGRVLVRRVGSVVTWTISAVRVGDGVTTTWRIIEAGSIPAGILPPYQIFQPVMGSNTNQSRAVITPAGRFELHYAITTTTYTAVITYHTSQAWPTTLPGVADGDPVGV